MNPKTDTILIRFSNPISFYEVEYFRGAVVNAMKKANVLFHNHIDSGYRYSYPLIQYKTINRKAAIFCIGEGADAIGQYFSEGDRNIWLHDRNITLAVETLRANKVLIQPWQSMFTYRIRKWIPLNSENYEKFNALESLAERSTFLERLLMGNILSMAKGLGIWFEEDVKCKIVDIIATKPIRYKGVVLTSIDVEFKTNISLPDYCGLGKGVSVGMGMVVRKKEWEGGKK